MMKMKFSWLVALLICAGCSPSQVEYKHLSDLMNERVAEVNALGLKSIRSGMTLKGYGFTIDGELCPGEYVVTGLDIIGFDARLAGNQWIVTADESLKPDRGKEDTSVAFNLILNSLVSQCQKVVKMNKSWNDAV